MAGTGHSRDESPAAKRVTPCVQDEDRRDQVKSHGNVQQQILTAALSGKGLSTKTAYPGGRPASAQAQAKSAITQHVCNSGHLKITSKCAPHLPVAPPFSKGAPVNKCGTLDLESPPDKGILYKDLEDSDADQCRETCANASQVLVTAKSSSERTQPHGGRCTTSKDAAPTAIMGADGQPMPIGIANIFNWRGSQTERAEATLTSSVTGEEFESFSRDVAARIIQAHWRHYQSWKLQLREAAEQRTWQRLLEDDTLMALTSHNRTLPWPSLQLAPRTPQWVQSASSTALKSSGGRETSAQPGTAAGPSHCMVHAVGPACPADPHQGVGQALRPESVAHQCGDGRDGGWIRQLLAQVASGEAVDSADVSLLLHAMQKSQLLKAVSGQSAAGGSSSVVNSSPGQAGAGRSVSCCSSVQAQNQEQQQQPDVHLAERDNRCSTALGSDPASRSSAPCSNTHTTNRQDTLLACQEGCSPAPAPAPNGWHSSRAAAAVATFEAAAAAAATSFITGVASARPAVAISPDLSDGQCRWRAAGRGAAACPASARPSLSCTTQSQPIRTQATAAQAAASMGTHRNHEQALQRLKRTRSLPSKVCHAALAPLPAPPPASQPMFSCKEDSTSDHVGSSSGGHVLLYSNVKAVEAAKALSTTRHTTRSKGLQRSGPTPLHASLGVRRSQLLSMALPPSSTLAPNGVQPLPFMRPTTGKPQLAMHSRQHPRPLPAQAAGIAPMPVAPDPNPQAAVVRLHSLARLPAEPSMCSDEDEIDAGDCGFGDADMPAPGETELPPHVHLDLEPGALATAGSSSTHSRYAATDEPLSPSPSPLPQSSTAAMPQAAASNQLDDGEITCATTGIGICTGAPRQWHGRGRGSGSVVHDLCSLPLLEAARCSGQGGRCTTTPVGPDGRSGPTRRRECQSTPGCQGCAPVSQAPSTATSQRLVGRGVSPTLLPNSRHTGTRPLAHMPQAGGMHGAGVAAACTPSTVLVGISGLEPAAVALEASHSHGRRRSRSWDGTGQPQRQPAATEANHLWRPSSGQTSMMASPGRMQCPLVRILQPQVPFRQAWATTADVPAPDMEASHQHNSHSTGSEVITSAAEASLHRQHLATCSNTGGAVVPRTPASKTGAALCDKRVRGSSLSGASTASMPGPCAPTWRSSPGGTVPSAVSNELHPALGSRDASHNDDVPPLRAVLPVAVVNASGHSFTTAPAGDGAKLSCATVACKQLTSDTLGIAQSQEAGSRESAVPTGVSLTAEKLASIFSYLDQVEHQAEQEAAAATGVAQPPQRHTQSVNGVTHASSNPALPAPPSVPPLAMSRGNQHDAVYRCASEPPEGEDGSGAVPAAFAGHLSTALAETVYGGVRARICRLQDDVCRRDEALACLKQGMLDQQHSFKEALQEAEARAAEALAAQRQEAEATTARHLAFVDRLLADKDELGRTAAGLAEQLQGSAERHDHAIVRLKESWAAELRRQKDGWMAGERAKREAWQEARTQEIKEATVKGLEAEVHKLLSHHKVEVAALQAEAAHETQRRMDAAAAQYDAASRQLKERLLKEQEDAVEKERAAGVSRLREASERYEQQMQAQRMRLVADADLKMEQLEATRKDERRRYDDMVVRTAQDANERQATLMEDLKREKDLMRKAHEKEVCSLREQYETNQEGWRAAIAERARRELAEREAALRERLTRERNAEIEAVVQRLETEAAEGREAAQEELRRREDAILVKHLEPLKEARKAEAKFAEKFRLAGQAQQVAEEKLAAADAQQVGMRRELEAKSATIRWLESQVSAAKQEAALREADLRGLSTQREALAAEGMQGVVREKEALVQRLEQGAKDLEELRVRHRHEMQHVEARIKTTISKKDEAITSLREQLAVATQQLHTTEMVLSQQQSELCI